MTRAQLLAVSALLLPSQAMSRDHSEVRQFVIRSQLAQAGENSVVFAGDSITESALLPSSVCGHPIVNAGIGGATAASYYEELKGIPPLKASLVVIAIGTNDAATSNDFPRDYSRLMSAITPYTPNLLLAGIPPFEDGALSKRFDTKRGEAINEEIARVAGDRFIDLRTELNSGHETIDGIHLSPDGYKVWLRAILSKLRKKLGC